MFWMHLSLFYKLSRPQSIHLLLYKYLLDFAAIYFIYIFFQFEDAYESQPL